MRDDINSIGQEEKEEEDSLILAGNNNNNNLNTNRKEKIKKKTRKPKCGGKYNDTTSDKLWKLFMRWPEHGYEGEI